MILDLKKLLVCIKQWLGIYIYFDMKHFVIHSSNKGRYYVSFTFDNVDNILLILFWAH